MVHRDVCREGDRRAGRYRDRRCRCAGATTDIATEVIGTQICDGRVVVGVRADVLVNTALHTVGRQLLEDV